MSLRSPILIIMLVRYLSSLWVLYFQQPINCYSMEPPICACHLCEMVCGMEVAMLTSDALYMDRGIALTMDKYCIDLYYFMAPCYISTLP